MRQVYCQQLHLDPHRHQYWLQSGEKKIECYKRCNGGEERTETKRDQQIAQQEKTKK